MTLVDRLRSPVAEECVAAIADLREQKRVGTEELAALADCLGHARKAVQRPAAEAFALSQRFEFYPTPKSGSWLNMIEIEFSALAKQCLDRRIPTQEELNTEVRILVTERQQQGILIHWQFSLEVARNKFSRHYQKVYAGPSICSKT